MDEQRRKFEQVCAEAGVEPTDERFFFWMAAVKESWNQLPVGWAYLAPDGSILQISEYLDTGRFVKPIPLFTKPVAETKKPDLHESVLLQIWQKFYAPDDIIGYAKWIEKISKSDA